MTQKEKETMDLIKSAISNNNVEEVFFGIQYITFFFLNPLGEDNCPVQMAVTLEKELALECLKGKTLHIVKE